MTFHVISSIGETPGNGTDGLHFLKEFILTCNWLVSIASPLPRISLLTCLYPFPTFQTTLKLC